MMKKLLVCVVFAAACGGGSKAAPTTETPAGKESAGSTKLTITDLKFYRADTLGVKLAADGTVSAVMKGDEWKDVGKLSTDGKLEFDGKVVAQLHDDGTVALTDSKDSFKLDGTALVAGDKRITIDATGVFTGFNPEMPTLRVEGLTDDGSKRTALLMLGVMSMGAAKAQPEK